MRPLNVSIRAWLPVFLWAGVILIAATDSFSAEQSRGWLRLIFGPAPPEIANLVLRKTAHLVEYGILGGLAWRASRAVVPPLLIALAVAAVDEFRQSFSAARTGSPWDVLIDLAGAAIVVALLAMRGRARSRGNASAE